MFVPEIKNDSIRAIAMPMSVETLIKLIKKYPAFAAAYPTDSSKNKYVKFDKKAMEYQISERPLSYKVDPDEENRNETVIFENADTGGTGWSHTRSRSDVLGQMYFNSATGLVGDHDPNNPHNNPVFSLDAFIRPEIYVSYLDARWHEGKKYCSMTANSVRFKTRTSKVYDNPDLSIYFSKKTSKLAEETKTSTAPIVKFGERPYIWLNKEECENGNQSLMQLVSEYGYNIAPPFDLKNRSTDLTNARNLINAYSEEVIKTLGKNEIKEIAVCNYFRQNDFYKANFVAPLKKYIDVQGLISKSPELGK